MKYEVEQKFRLQRPDDLEDRLSELGTSFGPAVEQCDHYFAHPARDFATTDEALRIRSVGALNYVTYKGPKVDSATKTRREIELPIESSGVGADHFAQLLVALGFTSVATVRKDRRRTSVIVGGRPVEICLDYIEPLGWFAELEMVVDDAGLDAARATVLELGETLGLTQVERRSYLEMLLFAG